MKKMVRFVFKLFLYVLIILLVLGAYLAFYLQKSGFTKEDIIAYFQSIFTKTDHLTLSDVPSTSDTVSSQSKKMKYYYEQLDDYAKIIYKALEDNIENLKKENVTISFATKFNTLLHEPNGQDVLNTSFQTAIDAFSYDYPELFYLDITKISLQIQYITMSFKTTYMVSIMPQNGTNYLNSKAFSSEADVDKAISKVENIRNHFVQILDPNSSDYEKALQAHDVLVRSLEYDTHASLTNTHNIYGAFTDKKVVCEGYAKAFKYLLDSLSINCILVSGNATNSTGKTESHMWNLIELDGNWYGVDVTWDDPIVIGGSSTNMVRHNYFCKGDATFAKSHVISEKISDEGKAFTFPTLNKQNYK